MKVTRVFCFALVVALVAVSGSWAYEFDAKTWRRDFRNLRRMQKLSEKMQMNFRLFAAEHGANDKISSSQHMLAEDTIQAYARIRDHLGHIAERSQAALPARPSMVDGLQQRLQGTVLGTAAGILMLENGIALVESFQGTIWEARLNRADNRSKWHMRGLFRDVNRSLSSASNKQKLTQAATFLAAHNQVLQAMTGESDEFNALLNLITSSTSLDDLKQENAFDRISNDIGARAASMGDRVKEGVYGLMNALSEGFGKVVGPVHTGHAKIVGAIRDKVHQEMMALLEPGDLLLDKTYFHLTDKFIPGYFAHVALWMGTVDQMEEHGLFDRSQNKISVDIANGAIDQLSSGRYILEALRPGIEVNTLEHFLHIDETVILRLKPQGRSPEKMHEIISGILHRGMYHLGQDYDFNFDVNTSDKIVCSELAYQSYPDSINLPTEVLAGRPTITADNVAVMSGPTDEFPLEVIYYYEEGNSHTGADAWRAMWKALKNKGGTMPSPEVEGNRTLVRAIENLDM